MEGFTLKLQQMRKAEGTETWYTTPPPHGGRREQRGAQRHATEQALRAMSAGPQWDPERV